MSVDPAKSQSNALPQTSDSLLGAQSCINNGSSPHSSTTDFIFVIISVLVILWLLALGRGLASVSSSPS